MGLFKDMRKMQKDVKDMGIKRPSLREGMAQASEAIGNVKEQQEAALKLQQSGKPGTATIKAMRDMGQLVNHQPVIEFDLTVEVGGFTHDVTHKQPVPPTMIGQLQPGATINVLVDPDEPTTLLFAG